MMFCSPCNGKEEHKRQNALVVDLHPAGCSDDDDDSSTQGMSSTISSASATDTSWLDTATSESEDVENEMNLRKSSRIVRIEDMDEFKILSILHGLLLSSLVEVESIELRGNRICLEGARSIRRLFQNKNFRIQDFTFCLNKISEEGMAIVSEGIQMNCSLKSVDFSSNSLNDSSVSKICGAISFHNSIEVLNMDFNSFGEKGVAQIGQMLAINSSLIELHLFGNKIGPVGAAYLADALKKNDTLDRLVLTLNQIGTDGATSLAHALSVNSSLRYLSIAANNIHSLASFGSMLPNMQGLEYLNVGDIYSIEEVEALIDGLEKNTRLISVHLESPVFGEIGSTAEARLDFLLRLNKCGRSLMHAATEVPAGAWSHCIAKASLCYRGPDECPDVLYSILRGRPELIEASKHR